MNFTVEAKKKTDLQERLIFVGDELSSYHRSPFWQFKQYIFNKEENLLKICYCASSVNCMFIELPPPFFFFTKWGHVIKMCRILQWILCMTLFLMVPYEVLVPQRDITCDLHFQITTKKMQRFMIYLFLQMLYMLQAVPPPIIRSM